MALDKPQVVQMLRTMILIREFDELAIKLRVAGKIYGAVHPYVGQEAVAVGVCANLTHADRVTSTHRGHGHCIAKGADIKRMMAELFGRVDGYCKGKGGSMHIADFAVGMLGANGIVGGGLPIACGRRAGRPARGQGQRHGVLLRRRRGRRGRVPRGAQHRLGVEAAHRLRLREQPVRGEQRGRRAASRRRHRRARRRLRHARRHRRRQRRARGPRGGRRGRGAGAARRRADPPRVQDLSLALPRHARTRRRRRRRPAAEIASWKARDPIARLEQHVLARGVLSAAEIGAMRERVHADLDEAVAFAEASPFPDPKDLLVDMFAE